MVWSGRWTMDGFGDWTAEDGDIHYLVFKAPQGYEWVAFDMSDGLGTVVDSAERHGAWYISPSDAKFAAERVTFDKEGE